MYLIHTELLRKGLDYVTTGQVLGLETLLPSVSNMTKEIKKTNA